MHLLTISALANVLELLMDRITNFNQLVKHLSNLYFFQLLLQLCTNVMMSLRSYVSIGCEYMAGFHISYG